MKKSTGTKRERQDKTSKRADADFESVHAEMNFDRLCVEVLEPLRDRLVALEGARYAITRLLGPPDGRAPSRQWKRMRDNLASWTIADFTLAYRCFGVEPRFDLAARTPPTATKRVKKQGGVPFTVT